MNNLAVETELNINDECLATIKKKTKESNLYRIHMLFTGWATKKEIKDAILHSAKARQSRSRRFQYQSNAS